MPIVETKRFDEFWQLHLLRLDQEQCIAVLLEMVDTTRDHRNLHISKTEETSHVI